MIGAGRQMTRSKNVILLFVSLALLFLNVAIRSTVLLVLAVFAFSCCLSSRFSNLQKYAFIANSGIMCMLTYLKVMTFDFFPQALYLYEINDDLLYWFKMRHEHAVRLLIAYPGALISKAYDLPLDYAFGFYMLVVFILIAFFFLRNINEFFREQSISGLFLLIVTGFAFVMNGRIAFPMLASMMLVFSDIKYMKKEIGLARLLTTELIGLLLSMTSSGTMMIVLAYIVLAWAIRIIYSNNIVLKKTIIFLVLALALPFSITLLPYIIFFINKNIDYYGGGFIGFIGIFRHGIVGALGIDLSNFEVVFLMLAGIAFFVLNILLFKKIILGRKYEWFPMFLFANIGFYGLFVGLSAGSLMLLPLFIAFLSIKENKYLI